MVFESMSVISAPRRECTGLLVEWAGLGYSPHLASRMGNDLHMLITYLT